MIARLVERGMLIKTSEANEDHRHLRPRTNVPKQDHRTLIDEHGQERRGGCHLRRRAQHHLEAANVQ